MAFYRDEFNRVGNEKHYLYTVVENFHSPFRGSTKREVFSIRRHQM